MIFPPRSNQKLTVWKLYIYPIKSLRGISVTSAPVTETGFAHDREFMLLKVDDDKSGEQSLKNMHVPDHPEMSLFTTEFYPSESQPDQVTVTYTPSTEPTSSRPNEVKTLRMPLSPDTSSLEPLDVVMHSAKTRAYRMPSSYSSWFSTCFGYKVVLAYIGHNTRPVLGNLSPNYNKAQSSSGWGLFNALRTYTGYGESNQPARISFADCASFLVVTEESNQEASRRIGDGEKMDVTKFRPNIVVSGSPKEWDEDYWASIILSPPKIHGSDEESIEIIFTANCARCPSLNVDYATGKMGKGPSGQILKKLQADRRIDFGMKYSPVFGRYGFVKKGLGREVKVGAKVEVESRNEEYTKFGEFVLYYMQQASDDA